MFFVRVIPGAPLIRLAVDFHLLETDWIVADLLRNEIGSNHLGRSDELVRPVLGDTVASVAAGNHDPLQTSLGGWPGRSVAHGLIRPENRVPPFVPGDDQMIFITFIGEK